MAEWTSISELTGKNVETIKKMDRESQTHRSLGERVADIVATVIGSWPFIIIQSVVLFIWIALNLIGSWQHWDPYPFILLNLALSFQAAYASPIIMMSQNRQARLSERRNHLDLQINMLSEQENTQMLRLLRKLCEQAGIELEEVDAVLEEATEPEKVISQIEQMGKATKREDAGEE